MTDNIHSQMGFDWPQHPRAKKIDPVPLNHLADAIATGDNMEALFKANPNYLIGLTSLITAETATLSIDGPGSSILLAENTFNDRMILMPMRM